MKLFVYGILKQGFELDLNEYGAKFLGKAQLPGAVLYHIGGGVGLRFHQDPGQIAHGEVYEIPDHLWPWLDDIESNGFCYTRKKVQVMRELDLEELVGFEMTDAWVYEHTFPGMDYKPENIIEDGVFQHEHVRPPMVN